MTEFKRFQIQTETSHYNSRAVFIQNDFIYYERTDFYDKTSTVHDTFGPQWIFAWGHFSKNQLSLLTSNRTVELEGTCGILIPPFHIIHWKIASGPLMWKAFVLSEQKKEAALPQISTRPSLHRSESMYFIFSSDARFASEYAQILQRPDLALLPNLLAPLCRETGRIEQQIHPCASSIKIKQFIDENYKDSLEITELAHRFKTHPVVLSRRFSKAFGLSPLQYRQRVRLFEALHHINNGCSITESIFTSGFSDLSEFNRQFKNTFKTQPRAYSPRWSGMTL